METTVSFIIVSSDIRHGKSKTIKDNIILLFTVQEGKMQCVCVRELHSHPVR